eukprot:6196606-Pleurochrysis_carterae.AAC.4
MEQYAPMDDINQCTLDHNDHHSLDDAGSQSLDRADSHSFDKAGPHSFDEADTHCRINTDRTPLGENNGRLDETKDPQLHVSFLARAASVRPLQ